METDDEHIVRVDKEHYQSLLAQLAAQTTTLRRIATDYYHDRHAIWAKEALARLDAADVPATPTRAGSLRQWAGYGQENAGTRRIAGPVRETDSLLGSEGALDVPAASTTREVDQPASTQTPPKSRI